MNAGILPCKSSKVWSLTAALVLRTQPMEQRQAWVYGGGIQHIDRIVELQAIIVSSP